MKRLLIVVDYQKDFVSGALGFPGAELLDDAIAKKIADYRAAGDVIAFTLDTHGGDYLETQEGKRLPIPHCVAGTDGWELFGETAKRRRPEDPVFEKNTFGSAALFDWLRKQDFDVIELAGLVLNICVISNAVLAKTALPEAEIVVDARAVGGGDAALLSKALDVLENLQVTVENRET